jgi:odorant receptor
VAVECFFFGCCLNISKHFDILRESFDGDKKKFVEKHLEILDLVKELNETFKQVVFSNFLLSSLLLCVLGFQLVMIESFAGRIVPATFGVSVAIQLFVYAFGGQLIIDKSNEVARDFYDIDRNFLIMIARPRLPAKIQAGFFTANLPTFVSVMNSTGSLITMLKSFN